MASTPGRVKRVAWRKSRISSQRRASATSPRRAAATSTSKAPARSAASARASRRRQRDLVAAARGGVAPPTDRRAGRAAPAASGRRSRCSSSPLSAPRARADRRPPLAPARRAGGRSAPRTARRGSAPRSATGHRRQRARARTPAATAAISGGGRPQPPDPPARGAVIHALVGDNAGTRRGLRLLELDAEPLRGLGHLAGDRLGLALRLGAQRVRLLGGELLDRPPRCRAGPRRRRAGRSARCLV